MKERKNGQKLRTFNTEYAMQGKGKNKFDDLANAIPCMNGSKGHPQLLFFLRADHCLMVI